MTRRVAITGVVIAALGLGGIAAWQAFEEPSDDPGPGAVAAGLATALASASNAALKLPEAHRCARLGHRAGEAGSAPQRVWTVGERTWRIDGHRLRRDPANPGSTSADARLTIGVIADARGATRHLEAIRSEFVRLDVDLVLSLGGLGRDRDDIAEILGALTAPETWLVVALPGDRESVSGHRAAVAGLRERGVVDGSRIRLVTAGAISLATLPGAPHIERLVAGPDGCLHDRDDARHIADALAEEPGIRLFASHVPPRQRSSTASDMTTAGIAIGEPWLTDIIRKSGARVALHGLVTQSGETLRGAHDDRDGSPVFLSAGALDGLPPPPRLGPRPAASSRRPSGAAVLALVLVVDGDRITWQRLAEASAAK